MSALFSDAEITVLAALTFGSLDSRQGLSSGMVAALDTLCFKGFAHRRERHETIVWTLREVPPMVEAAVAARVRKLEDMSRGDSK